MYNYIRYYTKGFLLAIIAVTIFSFFTNLNILYAQATRSSEKGYGTPLEPHEAKELQEILNNSTCPESIVDAYNRQMAAGETIYVDGTLVSARIKQDGKPDKLIYISCANINSLEKILVRFFMLIFSIIGLVLAFSLARGTIMMMTAMGSEDNFKKGLMSIVYSIMYTILLIFSYTIFIFVMVGVLGVGTNSENPEYNLFCQNRIILSLTFNNVEECK